MVQVNKRTGKSRAIRAPNKWKAPTQPLVHLARPLWSMCRVEHQALPFRCHI